MLTIPVRSLKQTDFADLGTYYNILDPSGFHRGGFYHDKVLFPVSGGSMPVSFSSYVVEKPAEMVISSAEYCRVSPKGILPMDGDVICFAAPPSRVVYPSLMQAFIIPQGTLVVLNAGVWQRGCYAAHEGSKVHTLIILPQLAHKLEMESIELPYGEWVQIVEE